MLRSLKDLEGYVVSATDGEIGSVENFLLDDERWGVRYLIVKTGGFLHARRVLISPISFRAVDWESHRFHVALTMNKVKGSPSIDDDMAVTRQHEREYSRYYSYPYYWGSSGLWGMGAYPGALAGTDWIEPPPEKSKAGDRHLRSAKDLRGYHIQGSDDVIGHVCDFVVDDETWMVRYLAIDTSNWWFGKKVLIAPYWAKSVSWEERKVAVDLSRDIIKACPEWETAMPVNREYETRLYDYYGRPAYWGSAGGERDITTP